MKKYWIVLVSAALVFALPMHATEKLNVLFIAVDDLRPELGCYGSNVALSPNIDQLAKESLVFNRAYCQQAICGPSRASLMCGARPETIGVIENYAYYRDENPDIVTLSQHFIANGYEAVQIGKIFHKLGHSDIGKSWSREPKAIDIPVGTRSFALPENIAIVAENKRVLEAKYGVGIGKTGLVQGPAYECADVSDETYRDGYNAAVAIEMLKDYAESEQPFFMGLGFYKPHLSFIAPKQYWDLYDRDAIPLAEHGGAPVGGAAMGLHASFETRVRHGMPKSGVFDEELSKTLKHAYLACVSYIDAQIGKVINALDEAGLRENTIIVLWGDHGWHLGDMGVWGKATNYEISARVPMMVSAPEMCPKSAGVHTDALVELVDLYPTLCDLAGLDQPDHLEGQSIAPLLVDPSRNWKQAAFTQFPNPALREWAANPLSPGMRETFFGPLIEDVEERIIEQQAEQWDRDLFENRLMGYAMRTDRYRLIVWKDYTAPDKAPVFVELYDHVNDPDETKNIAAEVPELVDELLVQFNRGWQGNLAVVEQ